MAVKLKKILLYPLSAIFYLAFGFTLVFCHLIQWLAFHLGGYSAHKKSVDFLNFSLMGCLYLIGNRCTFENAHKLPEDQPLIVVANHQSMFDIIALGWFLRMYHPKFISKIELGKNIPSVSFNLNRGGSVLIDRKNPRQSIPALTAFGRYIQDHAYMAIIFPEGTRSVNGKAKKYNTTGLKILLKNIPDAVMVPVSINNSWKLLKYGSFPINSGVNLKLKVHQPISAQSLNEDELLQQIEITINKDITV